MTNAARFAGKVAIVAGAVPASDGGWTAI